MPSDRDKFEEEGHQPLEQNAKWLIDAMKILDLSINGDKRPKEFGIVLAMFPYGEGKGRFNYISNGADRRDMIKLFREMADKFEKDGKQ